MIDRNMTTQGKSVARVATFLASHGLADRIQELSDSTRTAQEAASSIGCEVAQIAKSIVFRNAVTQEPVLVVASGVNRVATSKIAAALGAALAKADADFIRTQTGFVIGGVPPAGHIAPITTYLDEDLLSFDQIWAAAGTPHAVFRLTPRELEAISGGCWLSIRDE